MISRLFFSSNTASRVDAKRLNFILMWPQHSFSRTSKSSGCLFPNFKRAWTCVFTSSGTLRALHDFSLRRYSVLLMGILVTVVSAALRSSTSSCHIVLRCYITFIIIRCTRRWEILRGAQDRGRLIVNRFFPHFLIIELAVDSSSSCSPF